MSENTSGGCGCGCGGHARKPAPPTGRDLGLKAARPGEQRGEGETRGAGEPAAHAGACGCGGH